MQGRKEGRKALVQILGVEVSPVRHWKDSRQEVSLQPDEERLEETLEVRCWVFSMTPLRQSTVIE